MRDPRRFRIAAALKAAIERAPESLSVLGYHVGLHQSTLSSILHGKVFSVVVRDRLVALGARLGVPADACAVAVKDGRS